MREREREREREKWYLGNGQQFTYVLHSHINTTNNFSIWTLIRISL